jgi:hypothetical protein
MKRTSIEPLEARIAPATILTFTDVDGDAVSVVSNKALTASVAFTAGQNPAELLITGAGLDGANLAVLVKRAATGDGVVNIGRIVATGLDLGAVSVKGDLGKIIAGNAGNPLPAIQSLTVRSMGILGTETQGGGNLTSTIIGDVGAITVAGDMLGAALSVSGKIGTMKIGGDLRGTATTFSGRITANGIASLTIGGDLAAGEGDESGKLIVAGDLGMLAIGGSVFGALDAVADTANGQITVIGNAGPIAIKRDIFGAVAEQKALDLRGNAGAITIGGSVFGSAGKNSGSIFVAGNSGAVTIGRDLNGSSGSNSGSLYIIGSSGFVKIGHDVNGSSGAFSAEIAIGGPSNVLNSTLPNSGFMIGGDLRGGTGMYRDGVDGPQVTIGPSTGHVRIGGSIIGGPTAGSGNFVMKTAKSFFLGGSIKGGGEQVMGVGVFPGGAVLMSDVASVTVQGGLIESAFGGGHLAAGKVGKLLIRGSIIENTEGSIFPPAGSPLLIGDLTTGRIEGSIVGTTVSASMDYTVALGGNIKKLEILGSLDGGVGSFSGSVRITGSSELIKIGGSLRAGTNADTGALSVTGRVAKLVIGGGIEGGGGGSFSGAQVSALSFEKVSIAGDLVGGSAGAGEIRAKTGGFDAIAIGGSLISGKIAAARGLGVVKIGGSILGSTSMNQDSVIGLNAKSIAIGGDLIARGGGGNSLLSIRESAGIVKIGGDIRGTADDPAHLVFALTAGFTNAGFTSLAVKGGVTHGLITGGIRTTMVVENADPALGPVSVGGDWVASSIAAGVARGADMQFATGDDTVPATGTPAVARIAAITIKGQVLGTATAGDHFGFVAQNIGPVKIAGIFYTAGAVPVDLGSITPDVEMRLIPA